MVYGANQKPRIEELSWLSFNLSHSGMRAMCSIGSFENGCDVERVHTMRMEQISSRFYSKKEQSFLASIEDQAEREDAFFRLWTLKESVIKFTGRGMTQGLDTFSMDLGGKHPVMTEEPGGLVSTCRFREYQLGDGYHYSCCAAEDRFEEDVRIVNLLSVL
jgi:4'-phosphopantetheinyl transferase